MRTSIALLLALLPAVAWSQSAGSITITESSTTSAGGKNDAKINIVECNGTAGDSLSLQWTLTGTNANYSVAVTTGTCGSITALSDNGTTTHFLITNQTVSGTTGTYPSSGSFSVRTSIVTPLALDCTSTTVNICVILSDSAGGNLTVGASAGLPIDAGVPAAPLNLAASSGDSLLHVDWQANDTGTATPDSYQVSWVNNADSTDKGGFDITSGTATSTIISGLRNGNTYTVTLIAFSDAGNQSPPATATGTPYLVNDFWRLYKMDGGKETGGCDSGGSGLLSLLSLALWRLRSRRRAA